MDTLRLRKVLAGIFRPRAEKAEAHQSAPGTARPLPASALPLHATPIPLHAAVQALRKTLNAFIEESEAEFLELGRRLISFSKVSRNTSQALQTGIAAATAGASGTPEHEQLKLTFAMLQTLVEATRGDTQKFSEVAQLINELNRKQDATMRTLSSLSFVGLYLSLESVRLPEEQRQGFSNLRKQMADLQGRVVGILEGQQQDLDAVRATFARCMGEIDISQERLSDQLVARQRRLESQFAEAMHVSPEVAVLQAKASEKLAEIAPVLSGLISTLQSHDSVRQRLVHVMDALEKMGEAEGSYQDALGFRCFMEQASLVQLGQLTCVQQILSKLTDDIRCGFQTLASSVADLAKLAVITEDQKDGQRSKTSEEAIKREIHDLRELIGDFLLLNEQLKDSSAPVESLAGKCSTLISEVSLIIKRTALNVQIYAAHTGGSGGLDALGAEARLIADESISHSVAISDDLGALTEGAQEFRDRLEAANSEHRAQQDKLAGCMGTLAVTLEETRRGVAQSLDQVRAAGAGLQEETAAQLDSLHFLDKGAHLVNEMSAVLEKCKTGADQNAGTGLDRELSALLEWMRSQYTMEQERMVHSQLSEPGAAAQHGAATDDDMFFDAPEEPSCAAAAQDDDGVEFF